jgi:hypothetical protein
LEPGGKGGSLSSQPWGKSAVGKVVMSFEECLGGWPAAERSDAPGLYDLGLRKLSHQPPNSSKSITTIAKSGKILAARTKRVAATDSPGTFGCATPGTIFAYRHNEVMAAGRVEATLTTNERAERPLVNPNGTNQHGCRNVE